MDLVPVGCISLECNGRVSAGMQGPIDLCEAMRGAATAAAGHQKADSGRREGGCIARLCAAVCRDGEKGCVPIASYCFIQKKKKKKEAVCQKEAVCPLKL